MKKSKKGFLEQFQHSELAKKVFDQIGLPWKELSSRPSDFRDASGGVTGFIYYSDTHEFTMKNRKLIQAALQETADEIGEEVVALVNSFGVFRDNKGMDNDERQQLYKFLGGGKPEQGSVTNVLAWFALEETINRLDDYMNE